MTVRYPYIDHYGVQHGVTGSCHQLHMDADHSLLVDCGLSQGNETSADGRSRAGQHDVEFSLATIKATHGKSSLHAHSTLSFLWIVGAEGMPIAVHGFAVLRVQERSI